MKSARHFTSVVFLLLGWLLVETASAECVVGWRRGMPLPDVDGTVHAMAAWDDGTGEALYAGGAFRIAHDVLANNIARYDGQNWKPLGAGIGGQVEALVVYRGRLYVGGSFQTAGSVSVRNLACWDGTNWADVGQGVLGKVSCLAVRGDDLIVGGQFTEAGGTPAENLARWDGLSWSSMGGCSGPEARVNALLVTETDLIVGGRFSSAGGVPVNNIARHHGGTWQGFGAGIGGQDAEVFALADYWGGFFAGGSFAQAGEAPAQNVAFWSGESWRAADPGLNGPVRSLAVSHDDYGMPLVIAAGQFTTPGGTKCGIAMGNELSWGIGGFPETGETLAFWGDHLYAAGIGRFGHRIYKWLGGALWMTVGHGSGMNGRVESFAVWNGALIGAGQFQRMIDPPVAHVSSFTGEPGLSGVVYLTGVPENPIPFVLTVHNNELIVGGQFTGINWISAQNIAKFTGSQWVSLGSGLKGAVTALSSFNSSLYAATITTDGSHVGRLSRWSGAGWVTLLDSSDLYIEDMVVYSPTAFSKKLIIGGTFASVGGVSARNIAAFNGSSWSGLGSGIGNGPVEALAANGPDLIVGGAFTTAGDVAAQNIARWDGTAWSPLGNGCNGPVTALTFHQGQVVAGGLFTQAGDQAARNIAKCDIFSATPVWQPLGEGVDGRVRCLASYGNDVALGGDFLMTDNVVSAYYALWGPIVPEITGYSPTNSSTCGAAVRMSVSADRAATYQWRRGPTPLVEGGHFSGTSTGTLTIYPVSPEDVGSDYNCIISNDCGAVTSSSFRFSLYNAPLGDFDGDCQVSGVDVEVFSSCKTGPGLVVAPDCTDEDLDGDRDADQSDFGALQLLLK